MPGNAPNDISDICLSLAQARALQLAAMDLLAPPLRVAKKVDVLATLRSMNVLQIDTIYIVARSSYLVLWSRLGDYQPAWLDELLTEGALLEYWLHAACLLPIEGYPYYRWQMLNLEAVGYERTALRLASESVAHIKLIEHVREDGQARASDFDHADGRKGDSWWGWKLDKVRLETLFSAGEIMVKRRDNFRRSCDVRKRVLPPRLLSNAAVRSHDAVNQHWTLATVKAMGLAPARWTSNYFRHAGCVPRPHPDAWVETGALLPIRVENWTNPANVHPDQANVLQAAQKNKLQPSYNTLLSPFDPLVWDRERALTLFNFDYRIECYTPEAKRKYGYFTLPILIFGTLVGRLDAKAHRAEGVFELRAPHLESGVTGDDALAAHIADAVTRCAQWHQTRAVRITQTTPSSFLPKLSHALKQLSATVA